MNVQIDQLVKSLLAKDSLDNCSLQEVKEYAERNPYFGAAQLLLTKKLQNENPEEFNEQLQKTITFFHNPLWVKNILNISGTVSIIEKESENPKAIVHEKIITEPVQAEIKEEEIKEEEIKIVASSAEHDETEFTKEAEKESAVELPTFKFEPVDISNNDLLFEPLHTVDYFTSQGIKYKEEEKPVDKLAQQMKSFTDWLKTMKRLPAIENSQEEQPVSERKVEQLAEHSIKEREILTTAMAEVWEKQGNKDKAIDIYSKLSLLEPSKSPYFAAKIEELKKTN